jgi:hypothetical protein
MLEKCVSHGIAMYVCVGVGVRSPKKILCGAVWLRPLTNLEVPRGAGACTLEFCRLIWCGVYRSAVKVSIITQPPPPPK